VPADVEPPELARLIDFAERPRTDDWSLRAALVRYAQPQPQRVNDVLDLVRRVEWALGRHAALVAREGAAVWSAFTGDTAGSGEQVGAVVELLRVAGELDRLGDVLASWAIDPAQPRPDAEVDDTTRRVSRLLVELGVPEEERTGPPPRSRRR
jgi:hypothetical protein